MKRALLALLLIVLLLSSVLLVRTFQFESQQIEVHKVEPASVDAQKVAEQLSKAVQFQTISYEDPDRVDGEAFLALHQYLETAFPNGHATLTLEKVNEYSLLYTWPGSNKELEPALLMAHLDVVPVEEGTEENWSHPAYSGLISDGYIWGRGAMDDKHSVIAILHAVESLISEGFQPQRTLFLAFGHDEEVGGDEGAKKIAEHFSSRDVELHVVIDEGGAVADGSMVGLAGPIAVVGIAEKGYVNIELNVEVQGGHSSMPSKNTSVGILSRAITKLEENQIPGGLRPPLTHMFEYLGPELPFARKVIFANLWLFKGLVEVFFGQSPIANAMLRTTTAPTIFQAGVKANVLPSKAHAVVNFRILPGDTIESVTNHVRQAINDERVTVQVMGAALNPSEVSSLDTSGWITLQTTIRELFPDAVVVPYLLVAGSDSKHFAPLTDSIYRFAGIRTATDDMGRVHGTDERISLENMEELTRFYIHFIRDISEGE